MDDCNLGNAAGWSRRDERDGGDVTRRRGGRGMAWEGMGGHCMGGTDERLQTARDEMVAEG